MDWFGMIRFEIRLTDHSTDRSSIEKALSALRAPIFERFEAWNFEGKSEEVIRFWVEMTNRTESNTDKPRAHNLWVTN